MNSEEIKTSVDRSIGCSYCCIMTEAGVTCKRTN